MSLDVYLTIENAKNTFNSNRIFIREDGQNKEITREEWDHRFPDREPVTAPSSEESNAVYSANITHNLGTMANEAGIYEHLWRPDEIGIKAQELIHPLQAGLRRLRNKPERFKQFNPKNGWGTYEGLIEFVERYFSACEQYPEAKINISR